MASQANHQPQIPTDDRIPSRTKIGQAYAAILYNRHTCQRRLSTRDAIDNGNDVAFRHAVLVFQFVLNGSPDRESVEIFAERTNEDLPGLLCPARDSLLFIFVQ